MTQANSRCAEHRKGQAPLWEGGNCKAPSIPVKDSKVGEGREWMEREVVRKFHLKWPPSTSMQANPKERDSQFCEETLQPPDPVSGFGFLLQPFFNTLELLSASQSHGGDQVSSHLPMLRSGTDGNTGGESRMRPQ